MRRVLLLFLVCACTAKNKKVSLLCVSDASCNAGQVCIQGLCDAPIAAPTLPTSLPPPVIAPPSVQIQPPQTRAFIGAPFKLRAVLTQGTSNDATLQWTAAHAGGTATQLGTAADIVFVPAATGPLTFNVTATGTSGTATDTLNVTVLADEIAVPMQLTSPLQSQTTGIFVVRTDGSVAPLSSTTELDAPSYGGYMTRAADGRHVFTGRAANYNVHLSTVGSDTVPIDFTNVSGLSSCGLAAGAPTGTTTCSRVPKIRTSHDGRYLLTNAAYGGVPAVTGVGYSGVFWNPGGLNFWTDGGEIALYDLSVSAPTGRIIATNKNLPGTIAVRRESSPNYINDMDITSDGAHAAVTWAADVSGAIQWLNIGATGITGEAAPTGGISGALFFQPLILPDERVVYSQVFATLASAPPWPQSTAWRVVVSGPRLNPVVQTIVEAASSDSRFPEFPAGIASPSGACATAKAGGALGVSYTRNIAYALSPDGTTLAINHLWSEWTDCNNISNGSETGFLHAIRLYDVATGGVRNLLPTAAIPVDGNYTLSMMQFVAGGQQLAFVKQPLVSNLDAPGEVWTLNVDPRDSAPRMILGANAAPGNPVVHTVSATRVSCRAAGFDFALWILFASMIPLALRSRNRTRA